MFDAHCHLHLAAFDADRDQALARARRAGVTGFCSCAIGPGDFQAALDLAAREAGVVVGLGVHPLALGGWAEGEDGDVLAALDACLDRSDARLVALGECGLDGRLNDRVSPARQRRILEAQLARAHERRLPVILHCVREQAALLDSLRRFPGVRALLHAFSGSLEQARALLALDAELFFSFGGALTLPSKKRRALVRGLPRGRLLVETDAPDGPPIRLPDKAAPPAARLEPARLPDVVAALAALREEPLEAWRAQARQSAMALFQSQNLQ